MSEYGQEQISELDFVHWKPKNEIIRISSDDWHEKRNGKFAVPESSVLTVSTTTRHWAGRHATPAANRMEDSVTSEDNSDGNVSLTEVTAERPYRLAICGYELHRELEKIFGLPVSLTNNVWIWPFKHFVSFEPKIRQRLEISRAAVSEMEGKRLLSGKPTGEDQEAQASARTARQMSLASIDGELDRVDEEDERYESSLRLKASLVPATSLYGFGILDTKALLRATRFT